MGKKYRTAQKEQKSAKEARQEEEKGKESGAQYGWIPLWGWGLIFLLPLAFSEYMFYVAGRRLSMVLFPVAWVGFWYVVMKRSDWVIFNKRKQ